MPPSIGDSYALSTGFAYVPEQHNLGMHRTPWDRIREAMLNQGLRGTQKECAALLGIKQPSVSEWASAESSPSIENAITLSRKLNVCVEWILTERGPKRPGAPLEPAAQAIWDAWPRVAPDDQQRAAGFIEALARPAHPTLARKKPKSASGT